MKLFKTKKSLLGNDVSIVKTILVVEDDEELMSLIEAKLIAEGFEVLMATDGESACDVCNTDNPDLMLVDIMMPFMNGIDMVERVKSEGCFPKDTQVIFFTNADVDEWKKQAKKMKAEYLIKSDHSLSQIVERIKKKVS